MLLDLLQGASTMHHGASHPVSSLPDASSSAASLLHILQEGARAPANAFLDTTPPTAESQIRLPLFYTHPYHSTFCQHHDEIQEEHMLSMAHPSHPAFLRTQAPTCMHDNSKKLAPQLHLPSDDALEPSTSSATSDPSSTLVNMDAAAKTVAQNQQLRHLNPSSRRHIPNAVGFRSEDGAQQSTQTSLDEESSIQISTGENNAISGARIGEDTRATTNAYKRIEDSCSCHDNPACDVCNRAARDTIASQPTKKRKRVRVCKNSEEVESQRMTHIAVERNRRKQMNEHLNVLRSLMPATYIQRGDQASIIGGAIDFVKELEHVLQALHLKKQCGGCDLPSHDSAIVLESLMLKPYCMQRSTKCSYIETPKDIFAHLTCQGVDVEVNLIGSRALVKVLAQKLPHQLLNVTSSFEILRFKILHLNITTIEQSVLYAFNLEMQCESQTLIANDIAQSIHNVFKL